MIFNSIEFLIFFPIVIAIYFALPYRYRWIFLLAASYYFYMAWKPEYIILIIISTLIDYVAGLQMGKTNIKSRRVMYLIFSLCSNLGLLFAFKYFNLFNDSARAIFNYFNIFYGVPAFKLLLPVGISFYTFQTLSYTIDVYRGQKAPEKHLGIFALYVSFFPQLVAGPIERAASLLPQFYQQHDFDYKRVISGLQLMLWGLFKKVVIADTLAVYVNTVYNSPGEFQGLPVIIATYFFAFQIYCDFSGYSDIAIGAAQVLGFNLMENFRRPYFAQSISEFWGRWHISLSTWFKDYLYISLGGNRVVKWRWYFNLFIVFLMSGLWHGANWTFVIWGALHGFYLIFSLWTQGFRPKLAHLFHLDQFPTLQKGLQIFGTFHLVLFGWIFFRANSIADAFIIIQNIFKFNPLNFNFLDLGIDIAPGIGRFELVTVSLMILLLLFVHLLEERQRPIRQIVSAKPVAIRWAVYLFLVFAIMNLGIPQEIPFIYFQF
jgi:D-alanyl-lipoteichoic acid acyltransferase DltB (MBOAT superfamily)